jgi:hypothetical protein
MAVATLSEGEGMHEKCKPGRKDWEANNSRANEAMHVNKPMLTFPLVERCKPQCTGDY